MTVHPMVAAFRAAGVTAANIIVAKILKKPADTEVVHSWPKVTAPTAQSAVPRRWRGSSSNGVGAHGGHGRCRTDNDWNTMAIRRGSFSTQSRSSNTTKTV